MKIKVYSNNGYSYVKFAILIGLVAILGLLMLPEYKEDTIRTRVVQGLNTVEPAKEALERVCRSNSDAVVSHNSQAGYAFFEHMYVDDVKLTANCKTGTMDIRVRMQNTGAETDPVVVYMSRPAASGDNFDWDCALIKGSLAHAPAECRAVSPLVQVTDSGGSG